MKILNFKKPKIVSRAEDPNPHGSAFVLLPGSGSGSALRMKTYEKYYEISFIFMQFFVFFCLLDPDPH
jgi:hypothetical protein